MKNKIISVLIMSAIVLAIAVLVVAQSQQELENEKAQLELELISAGYNWLVFYELNLNIGLFNNIIDLYNKTW